MNTMLTVLALLVLLAAGAEADPPSEKPQQRSSNPTLKRTFPLEKVGGGIDRTGIAGRMDHLRYDPLTGRLFVACVANGSLEVIDLNSGTRVGAVSGLRGPQGVGVSGRFAYVSTGDDGCLHRFDTRSLEEDRSVVIGDDADNVRLAADGKIWVSFGGSGPGGISCLESNTLTVEWTLQLPKMPEGFQLDPNSPAIFANVPAGKVSPDDGTVISLNRQNGDRYWERKLIGRAGNFPMALDVAKKRIFIVSRIPSRVICLDAANGSILGEAECAPQSDDAFFDDRSGLVMVIGGGTLPTANEPGGVGASLDAFTVDPSGRPSKSGSVPLPPHSRTGTLIVDRRTIYVAVPPTKNRSAEVREYLIPE